MFQDICKTLLSVQCAILSRSLNRIKGSRCKTSEGPFINRIKGSRCKSSEGNGR